MFISPFDVKEKVRRLLMSNASVCTDKNDDFVIPDYLLDAAAKIMIQHDSHFLTDRFDDCGLDGLDDFIKTLVRLTFIPIDHAKLADAALELKAILIIRLRMEVEYYCDINGLEADVRETLKQNAEEIRESATPYDVQMKILGEGMDRILGSGDKK